MAKSIQQLEMLSDPQASDILLVLDTTVVPAATDGAISGDNLSTLTSLSALFSIDDSGRFITISGAGISGDDHVAVATYVNSTTLTISPSAISEVVNSTVFFAIAKKITIESLVASASGLSITHVQDQASEEWTIDHGLGRAPHIVLKDEAGVRFFAEVVDDEDCNSCQVLMPGMATAGVAYLI